MKNVACTFLTVALAAQSLSAKSDTVKVSPSARSALEIYDIGYARITELRGARIPAGQHDLVFQDLPASFVPGTSDLLSSGRSGDLKLLEQRYRFSLESTERLVESFQGQTVELTRGGDRFTGRVLHAAERTEDRTLDVLLQEGDRPRWVRDVESVKLLSADGNWTPEPRLIWTVDSGSPQSASLQIGYQAKGFDWNAAYTLIMDSKRRQASLSGKAGLQNRTSREFPEARITLVRTEQGRAGPLIDQRRMGASKRLRYDASGNELRFEQQLLGPASVSRFTLSAPVRLDARSQLFTSLVDIPEMPIEVVHVYDGVVFDRHQSSRRNDWNYGTESQPEVDVYLSYEDLSRFNVKQDLPGGRFRVFERGSDGGLLLVGDEKVDLVSRQGAGRIRIGSSPSVVGTRERTGYSEIIPLHEYEESFEIGLKNLGESEVTVNVMEHLYRWPEYEILKSDSEYEEAGPQKISFRVLLKPGGSRSLHYTVRYSW